MHISKMQIIFSKVQNIFVQISEYIFSAQIEPHWEFGHMDTEAKLQFGGFWHLCNTLVAWFGTENNLDGHFIVIFDLDPFFLFAAIL